MRIWPRAQIGPHLLRVRRRFAGPQSDPGVRVAALLRLLHLPVYGEDLVLRRLRPAPDRADQETDKSPHLLDDIGGTGASHYPRYTMEVWLLPIFYSLRFCGSTR